MLAVACVSGETDPSGANDGPECYTNADCSGGHECSMGVCVGFVGCGAGCRNNEDCLDNVCRLQCEANADCADEGLICGSDTRHCKPGKNPTRPQSQTQSGTGGTGSTGSTSHAGAPASAGSASQTGSGGAPGTAGAPGGSVPSGTAGSPAGVGGSAPVAPTGGMGNVAGHG